MKRLLLIFILTFSFQTLTKADDISDFEIEGISIGDSLLDYFSKDEIKSKKFFFKAQKENKKYASLTIDKNLKIFKKITINFLNKNHEIGAMSAFVNIKNFNECEKKRKIIVKDIASLFLNTENESYIRSHFLDKGTNISTTLWKLKDGFVRVACYDWSIESGFPLELRIDTANNKYANFLDTLN